MATKKNKKIDKKSKSNKRTNIIFEISDPNFTKKKNSRKKPILKFKSVDVSHYFVWGSQVTKTF